MTSIAKLKDNNDKVYLRDDDGNLSKRQIKAFNIAAVAEAIKLEWQTVVLSPAYHCMSRKKLIKALASASTIKPYAVAGSLL